MSLTPHGPGFSFLDSFEIIEPRKRGRGRKWLDPAAPFFADHFPGNPLMPGVLLIECAAQAAGVLWRPSGGAFLAAVSQFRFRKPVLPGSNVGNRGNPGKGDGRLRRIRRRLARRPDGGDSRQADAEPRAIFYTNCLSKASNRRLSESCTSNDSGNGRHKKVLLYRSKLKMSSS